MLPYAVCGVVGHILYFDILPTIEGAATASDR
jgi:hypothetical protein